MYDIPSSNSGMQKTAAEPSTPLLSSFHSVFLLANDEQQKIIDGIEEKLHNILNKKVPPDNAKEAGRETSDFITAADIQHRRLKNANVRLQIILNHLGEII